MGITLDAWGNTLSEENPHQLHQPIRMQGQQYGEESGLHYNRHRYYDPTIGRYITQDPIGLGWMVDGIFMRIRRTQCMTLIHWG